MSPSACRRRSVYLSAPHKHNPQKKKMKLHPCRPRRRFSLRPGANPKLPVTISFVDSAVVSQKQDLQERSLRRRRFSLCRSPSDTVETDFHKLSSAISGFREEESLFSNPWTTPRVDRPSSDHSPNFPTLSTRQNLPPRLLLSKGKKSTLSAAERPVECIDLSLPVGIRNDCAHNTNPIGVSDHESPFEQRPNPAPTSTPFSMALKGAYVPISPFSKAPPLSASTASKAKPKFRRYKAGSSTGITTVWYESCSASPISQPARTPAMLVGEIYLHFHHQGHQAWVLDSCEKWTDAYEGFRHPQSKIHTLRICLTGEPIWFKHSPNRV